MPLPVPNLDDRSFDDLVADLIARIPAHTPEWTHAREGDPGRTLIELFAFLGDALLYRVNQIPQKQRSAFLNLLGMPRRAASPARGLVQLALPEEARDAVDMRTGATIARPLPFETTEEVSLAPVSGEVYLKRRLDDGERRALDETIAQLQELYGPQRIEPYATDLLFADGLAAPGGVDVVADSVDGAVWIALLAPRARGGEDQARLVDAARAQLAADAESKAHRLLNVGLMPLLSLPDEEQVAEPRGAIPLLWEMSRPGADGATEFAALAARHDTTLGARKTGIVRLEPPGAEKIGVGTNARAANERSGVGGGEPPRLDDPDRQARLVAWLRARPDPAAGPVGALALAWLGIHAVPIEQMTTLTNVIVADADGASDAGIQLPAGDIDPAALEIDLAEDGVHWERWTLVEDLALLAPHSSRDARAFELDAQAGTLRFGDGVRGRVPAPGARVRASRMRSGGGSAGNLPAGTLKAISGQEIRPGRGVPPLKVIQPAALHGGADVETVPAAEARISTFLRHRERAVAADDYRVLAPQAPGVAVGRVELLARFKPQTRQFDVPGVVSVMVLPARDGVGTAPNPRADRPLIEAVHAHLDARRPLATELYVIGAEYVPVAASVAVGLRPDAPIDETLHAVRAAIARLLWPLSPGGHDGTGWTLGRRVIDRELEVEVARVPGVATVGGVSLFASAVDGWRLLPRGGGGGQILPLEPWQLPELLQVEAVTGDTAPEEIGAEPPPGEGPGRTLPVAVPVVPKVC